jgi:UDP-N-acetylglucosamine 4-epimerase
VSIFCPSYKVICFDNFATGHRHNLKDFINHPNFNLIEGDIRMLVSAIGSAGVDYVLHQAALGSARSIGRVMLILLFGEC